MMCRSNGQGRGTAISKLTLLPRTFASAISVMLISLILLAPSLASETSNAHQDATVKLVVDFNGERDKNLEFNDIPWQDEMTVEDVLRHVMKNEEFRFRSRGRGETFFVIQIAGLANQGAKGKNWIFLVNEKLGDRGAGAYSVPKDATVKWHFGKYNPKDE